MVAWAPLLVVPYVEPWGRLWWPSWVKDVVAQTNTFKPWTHEQSIASVEDGFIGDYRLGDM